MNSSELDTLVDAFVRYYNGRLRELCDEAGQQGLFDNYAILFDNDPPEAADAKRQKLAEHERVNAQLEEIFACRNIPMMPCSNGNGRALPVAPAVEVSVVVRDSPSSITAPTLDNLRAIVEAFASRRGIPNYPPRF